MSLLPFHFHFTSISLSPTNSPSLPSLSPSHSSRPSESVHYVGQIIRTADNPQKSNIRSRPLNRQDPIFVSQEDAMRIDGVSKNRLHSSRSYLYQHLISSVTLLSVREISIVPIRNVY